MKVLITSHGRTLEDKVAPSLGRCPYFLLVETWTGHVKPIVNDAAKEGDDTGAVAAHMAMGYGADMIVTKTLGPVAARVLEASGIPVYRAEFATARDALESLRTAPFLRRLDGFSL
jgi:predicted Fe-Mo cluster-binding NifX family protein